MHYNIRSDSNSNVIAETVAIKDMQITGLPTDFCLKDKGLPPKLLKILIIPLLVVIDCDISH